MITGVIIPEQCDIGMGIRDLNQTSGMIGGGWGSEGAILRWHWRPAGCSEICSYLTVEIANHFNYAIIPNEQSLNLIQI